MKIISEIQADLVRKIQDLTTKKAYKDISEFVRIAVENQLSLEFSSKEPLEIKQKLSAYNGGQVSWQEKLRLDLERSIIVELNEPEFKDVKSSEVETEQQLWLWGQVNKIFPVKFALRYLYNLLKDGEESIVLNEFYKRVSDLGRELGVFLSQEDDSNDKRRDERLSIAFPIGEEKSKSFSRFCSQFVGYRKVDNTLSGALFILKFANLKGNDKNSKIGITKSGVQFAKIINPVFDEGIKNRALSADEIDFYLDHIIRKVPGEALTFFLLLDLINKGTKSREMLNEKIKEFIPFKWSDDIINTQRTGAMSRLYELGLIEKTRHGIFVEYGISQKGEEYLKKYAKAKKQR